jgi:ubiquinol-cytochrome c reductase cytochrome b subunit
VVAYWVTKRICLGLQRKDAELLSHGVEIGIIHQLPNGEFVEESRPLTEEERAVVASKAVTAALPEGAHVDENGIPAPASKGLMGKARVIANRAFLETVEEANGHHNGHDEHAEHAVGDAEHAAVTSGDSEAH